MFLRTYFSLVQMKAIVRSGYIPFLLCACVLFIAGCGLLSPDRPEEARLSLEGAEGSTIQLITSANFFSQRTTVFDEGIAVGDTLSVVLFEADTINITLPFERTYDIREFERFYAEIQRPNPASDLLYSRVWIDGDLRLDKRGLADEDTLVFAYDFRIGNGEDPNVTF